MAGSVDKWKLLCVVRTVMSTLTCEESYLDDEFIMNRQWSPSGSSHRYMQLSVFFTNLVHLNEASNVVLCTEEAERVMDDISLTLSTQVQVKV